MATATSHASVRADPVAFMSYAHADYEDGRLSTFCKRLIKELGAHMGADVEIFMDKDIDLGTQWRERITEGLAAATFLLPIITPSYLKSQYCCDELQAFLEQERALGRDDLILPVYYVDCEGFLDSVTDERVSATWRVVTSRQFVDWRELRQRPPSNQRVQRERTKLAKQIQRAMIRAKTDPPPPAQPDPVAAPAPEPPPLEALFDPDPMISWAAAREIAVRGPEDIAAIVERLHGMAEPTKFVVGELLAQFPEVSGPLMVKRIKMASTQWQMVTQVPECFSPKHSHVCQDELAVLMHESEQIDVVRKAIEALGYVGSIDRCPGIASFLEKQAGSRGDLYDKYYGYCVTALARIVVLTPMEAAFVERVNLGFEYLEPAVRLVGSRGWQSIVYPNMQHILARCKPHHGDRLLSAWLAAPEEDMRDLGACALGGIGLGRAVPSLLERSGDPGELPAVRRTAMFAVGAIGGTEALEGLAGLKLEGEMSVARDDALTMCVGDAADDARFRELVERLIPSRPSEVCWVYRAIGRRGEETLLDLVREGLGAEETSVRGDAALALARLAGGTEGDALRRARAEASSTRERLLTSLALLASGDELADDPNLEDLRGLLAAESFLYRSATQRDILEALAASSHPLAAELADAWAPMYATSSAY